MGLPAAELYFSEEDLSPVKQTQQPAAPTFIEAAPAPLLEDKIKIIGIGNGGRNALNHIIQHKTEGVSFLAVDTDVRNLEKSASPNKIILGTRGIGAGCIPQNGETAARESLGEIIDFLRGADMVYLTAGMGGGTGTGAIPVIAEAAQNLGILTVAIVTKPFAFEGARKMRLAQEGIEKLSSHVDALIVIPNEKLLETSDQDTSIPEAFGMADEVLRQAVLGVTELITRPGMVNMDFADVKAVMLKSGISVMGTGRASGENRIEEAMRQAMESPLMEINPSRAQGVLMNITSAGTLTLFELQQAAANLENCVSEDTMFVWGTAEDPELCDDVKITIIATGIIDGGSKKPAAANRVRETEELKPVPELGQIMPQTTEEKAAAQPAEAEFKMVQLPKREISSGRNSSTENFIPKWLRDTEEAAAAPAAEEETAEAEVKDYYDIPSYIRRKKTAPTIK